MCWFGLLLGRELLHQFESLCFFFFGYFLFSDVFSSFLFFAILLILFVIWVLQSFDFTYHSRKSFQIQLIKVVFSYSDFELLRSNFIFSFFQESLHLVLNRLSAGVTYDALIEFGRRDLYRLNSLHLLSTFRSHPFRDLN